MSSTEVFTIKETGKLTLPDEIVERYQFKKEKPFRIIETQKGILLIPLTNEPASDELKNELEQWHTIGVNSWKIFN